MASSAAQNTGCGQSVPQTTADAALSAPPQRLQVWRPVIDITPSYRDSST